MDTPDDRISNLLHFSFLALIKTGIVVAVIPLVFAVLRAQDHYGHVRADAEITRTFVQCQIADSAAYTIGKKARWWDCEAASNLQRAFPKVALGISTAEFVEYRFTLPDGRSQQVSAPTNFLDIGHPQPGLIVPIHYSPDNPAQVRTVLGLEHWGILAFIGLSGLTIGSVGWQLSQSRAEFAARASRWLRQVQEKSATGPAADGKVRAERESPHPTRGGNGRSLGVG